MEMRKGEQPLVMIKMEVKTRVIVVVMAVAVIMDVMMMIAAPIVISDNNSSRVMIARTAVMIGVNLLMIEKMKM